MQTISTTPKQLQILTTIASFRDSNYYSPTIAEIAIQLGTSRTTVFEHIKGLRKKGLLSDSANKARSLKLTLEAQKLLKQINKGNRIRPSENIGCIALAGKVAAGVPIEAIENIEQLSLSSHFAANENTFALEVQGDSMIEENIYDGDIAICKKTPTASNGQLVIAIVDNENATLKRFYKENSRIRLQPANKNYEPIYTNNCRIEAVVVGLVRKF